MKDRLEAWKRSRKQVLVYVFETQATYSGLIADVDDFGFSLQTQSGLICFPYSRVVVYG